MASTSSRGRVQPAESPIPTTDPGADVAASGGRAAATRGMGYAEGADDLSPAAASQRVAPPPGGATTASSAATTATPDAPEAAPAEDTATKTVAELTALDYAALVHYLDTRDSAHVLSLGQDSKFRDHVTSTFTGEQLAQVVVRLILRVPGSVVEVGASRAEAIRILTSQLRDPEVCKNLLKRKVRVVIVPRNKLMTDLPEFAAQKGTYTFDGRPWDVTRGLGGRSTAITEENLLGLDAVGGDAARLGWHSQAWYEHDQAAGLMEANEGGQMGPKAKIDDGAGGEKANPGVRSFNAGVYCSGYSTTNHEFFHTIHQFGLGSADNKKITDAYAAKKAEARTVEWADGPRKTKAGADSENYASSTVYEYWAQTGCAYQGTNVGTDPYTGNDRNNGRSWVEANEPELAGLLAKVCSDSELANVNPRDARRAQEAAKAKASGDGTGAAAPATPAPKAKPATTPTTEAKGSGKDTPPPPAGGATLGLLQDL